MSIFSTAFLPPSRSPAQTRPAALPLPLPTGPASVIRLAANHRRSLGRQRRALRLLHSSGGPVVDAYPSDLADLDGLDAQDRAIVYLSVVEHLKADEIAALLVPSFGTIICTAAHHKGANAVDIAASIHKANPGASVQIAATIEDAVSISQRLAASRKQKIYVAGGLFLAIEYATIAGGGRAQDLDFF